MRKSARPTEESNPAAFGKIGGGIPIEGQRNLSAWKRARKVGHVSHVWIRVNFGPGATRRYFALLLAFLARRDEGCRERLDRW